MNQPSLFAGQPVGLSERFRRAAVPAETAAAKPFRGADGRFRSGCDRPGAVPIAAKNARPPLGFTLLEIILTLLILAIAIVPMMNAFAPALLVTGQGEEAVVLAGYARRTMNRLVDLPFSTLDSNRGNPANLVALFGNQADSNNNQNVVYLNTTYPTTVSIADASGGAGGILDLTVTLKGVNLQSRKANY